MDVSDIDSMPREPDPTLRILSLDSAKGQGRTLRASGRTDRGHVRERNEDQYLIARLHRSMELDSSSALPRAGELTSDPGVLLAVADGVGSIAGGEVASAMAIDALAEYAFCQMPWLQVDGTRTLAEGIEQSLRECQVRMAAAALRKGLDERMGTTLTAVHVAWPHVYVAHVGDSRAYLLRGGVLRQITHDQTLAQELVDHGAMTRAQLARSPFAHTLTGVLGGADEEMHLSASQLVLQEGDVLLLCTDGLHSQLDDADIADRLTMLDKGESPEACAAALVQAANAAGGVDNVTVVVAQC